MIVLVGLGMEVGLRYRNEVSRTIYQLSQKASSAAEAYGNQIVNRRAIAVLSVMAEIQSPLRESHRIEL